MFRHISILMGSALAIGVAPCWAAAPDRDLVSAIENAVRLPPHSQPVADYDRYYAMDTISGRPVVVGLYLATTITDQRERHHRGDASFWEGGPKRAGRLHILDRKSDLPGEIADGGCEEVHVYWDITSSSVAGVFCNGLG